MFADAIHELNTTKAIGTGRLSYIVQNMCSPELSLVLEKLYDKSNTINLQINLKII